MDVKSSYIHIYKPAILEGSLDPDNLTSPVLCYSFIKAILVHYILSIPTSFKREI